MAVDAPPDPSAADQPPPRPSRPPQRPLLSRPRLPARGRPRRRRYFHGGTIVMLVVATSLAVITSFVATFIYASVDAHKPIASPPTTASKSATSAPPPTAPPSTTTTTTMLTVDQLTKKINTSIIAVHTYDQQGNSLDGTALVVGSFGGQTLLLTSYNLVKAATLSPPAPLTVGTNQMATLWTWEESRDLALLVISGSVVALPWAPAPPNVGDKIYVGGAGAPLAVGIVTSVTPNGIAHNVFMDPVRQGAPLVNEKGEVLGIASATYDPDGVGTDSVFVAVPIQLACEKVIQCGGGNTAPGTTPTSTPLQTTTSGPTTTVKTTTTIKATTTTKAATTTTRPSTATTR